MKKTDLQNERFLTAARDYLYLLEGKYPQASVLKLVGDRFRLSGVERSVLYRGISIRTESERRAAKLVAAESAEGKELHIDGFNVLITIGSYLNGNLVFIGNDGYLRDASEIHGKVFRTQLFDKAILLVFSFLGTISPKAVHFYLDAPVSHSGELCFKINQLLAHYGMEGSATTLKSPDFLLKTITDGIIATSDSGIIDRCRVPVVDLPREIITSQFKKPVSMVTV